MKKLLYFLIILQFSCKTNTFTCVESKTSYGVDFSKGKWLLNELDTGEENKEELTQMTIAFFSKKLDNRFSFVRNEKGFLISQKSYFKSSKTELLDLKKVTGFDFLVNVVAKKNRSDLAGIQLYQKEVTGTNESEAFIEIVNLNTQDVIFYEHVLGKFKKNSEKSIWKNPNAIKSTKLIDNINVNRTSYQLLKGSLEKILNKLDKTSIKIASK